MSSQRMKMVTLALAFLFTSLFNFTPAYSAGSIEIGPYLYDMQSDSVLVMAVTTSPSDVLAITLKDSDGNILKTVSDNTGDLNKMNQYGGYSPRYTYKVDLSGLKAKTIYKYDATLCGTTFSSNSFTTAPSRESIAPYKFAVWGDTQNIAFNQKTAVFLEETKPDIVFHVGDLQADGRQPSNYKNYLFNPYSKLLRNAAFRPAPGNHDSGVTYLTDLFPTPRTNTSDYAGNMYYSYDYGDTHVVVIHMWSDEDQSQSYHIYDRNPDPVNGDVARLKKMLEEDAASPAATSAKWRVVLIHMPPDYIYKPPKTMPQSTKDAWNTLLPYLKKYDPNIVFFGHTHNFENTRVVNGSGLLPSEIKAMTVGLGTSVTGDVAPSYVEGFMDEYDSTTGKNVLRLKPHVWDGSTDMASGTFTANQPETVLNPPAIASVRETGVGDTQATVSWSTDEASDSRVDFGTDKSLKNDPIIQTQDNSLAHTVTLNNLIPGTKYYFRVKSKDLDGDMGRTDLLTFTTTGTAPTPTPAPTPDISQKAGFRQGENGYSGALDSRIIKRSNTPNSNYGGYDYIRLTYESEKSIGFLKFNDLFKTQQIPTDAKIVSAELKLFINTGSTASTNMKLGVFELTGTLKDSNYGTQKSTTAGSQPGTMCWNYIAYNSIGWNNNKYNTDYTLNGPAKGVDYVEEPYTTYTLTPQDKGNYVSVPLDTGMVQRWYTTQDGNKGIMLAPIEGSSDSTYYDAASADAVDISIRPQLIMHYLPAGSVQPTEAPTAQPTVTPTVQPTEVPTPQPTVTPTVRPTEAPTAQPTVTPTVRPTEVPTPQPTATPTVRPTEAPTAQPTVTPTVRPTPSPKPTALPGPVPKEKQVSGWARTAVNAIWNNQLASVNLFNNYQANIRRDEFADLAVRFYEAGSGKKVNTGDIKPFRDINGSLYAQSILKAYKLNIIKGVGEGLFKPNGEITRQEIAVMLFRTLKAAYPDGNYTVKDNIVFKDNKKISPWARTAIIYLYKNKVMNGTTERTISPLAKTTREQGFTMIYRMAVIKGIF